MTKTRYNKVDFIFSEAVIDFEYILFTRSAGARGRAPANPAPGGAAAPPGAGPENSAGAKAPPGAGPENFYRGETPPGAGPKNVRRGEPPPAAG